MELQSSASWIFPVHLLIVFLKIPVTGGKIYCQTELFQAKCDPGEVIVMQDARYGRMRLNRCVKLDFGYIGCSSEVLHILDRKCSGKSECELRIPDPELDATQPCVDDLTRYLDASFLCIAVYQPDPLSCKDGGQALVTSQSGFLSMATHSNAGTHSCPWLITASEGQRINLTLLEFDYRNGAPFSQDPGLQPPGATNKACHQYAIITDLVDQSDFDVCSSHKRLSHAFLSKGHSMEIRVPSSQQQGRLSSFLLKYEVVGCSKLVLSDEYWVEYSWTSSAAQVGCRGNSNSWRLRCQGNEWVGEKGNCTDQQATVSSAGPHPDIHIHTYHKNTASYLPKGFAVFLIVLIALIVGLCVVVFGLILSRRRKMKRKSNAQARQNGQMDHYAGFAETKEDIPHQDIEFDIYRHHTFPAHVQIAPHEQYATTQQPMPASDYLYTLRLDDNQSKDGVIPPGSSSPVKKCTCRHGKMYDIPANLKSCVPPQTVCVPHPSTAYVEWERSSLLTTDHEPDIINVAKADMDADG